MVLRHNDNGFLYESMTRKPLRGNLNMAKWNFPLQKVFSISNDKFSCFFCLIHIRCPPFRAINCAAFPQGKKTPIGALTKNVRAIHPWLKSHGVLARIMLKKALNITLIISDLLGSKYVEALAIHRVSLAHLCLRLSLILSFSHP